MTQEDRSKMKERFVHAKTKDEFLLLGVELFYPVWWGTGANLVKCLDEEWERRQNETPAERRRRKMKAFWWELTKPLRYLVDDLGLIFLSGDTIIALVIAILALLRSS